MMIAFLFQIKNTRFKYYIHLFYVFNLLTIELCQVNIQICNNSNF